MLFILTFYSSKNVEYILVRNSLEVNDFFGSEWIFIIKRTLPFKTVLILFMCILNVFEHSFISLLLNILGLLLS